MVAFVKSIVMLLASSGASRNLKKLPPQVMQSQGRIETVKPSLDELSRTTVFHKLADDFFPGCLRGEQVFVKTINTLELYGLDKESTLCALSVCPDEINHKIGDITDLFHGHFGRVFHLGGLGGIPFTGKTGFSAYSNHVTEHNGNCFVVMAPHIGLSSTQLLGMYTTNDDPNNYKERSACGAAIGALQYCLAEKQVPDLSDDASDYQEDYIIQQVKKHQEEIVNQDSDNAMQATLAHHMWQLGKEKLDQVVNTDFGGPRSKLMVLTGVMINMPPPYGDLFQPLTFDLYLKDGTVLNVFEETFGRRQSRISKLKP